MSKYSYKGFFGLHPLLKRETYFLPISFTLVSFWRLLECFGWRQGSRPRGSLLCQLAAENSTFLSLA